MSQGMLKTMTNTTTTNQRLGPEHGSDRSSRYPPHDLGSPINELDPVNRPRHLASYGHHAIAYTKSR
jgi:hypothetical protein